MNTIEQDLEMAEFWAQGVNHLETDGWRATCKRLADEVRRLRAEAVPPGWQAVPIYPTSDMLDAAYYAPVPAVSPGSTKQMALQINIAEWQAMLAAAPKPDGGV